MTSTRLEAFLYILVRDHLPFGVIEKIIREHLTADQHIVCEKRIGEWCRNTAARLGIGHTKGTQEENERKS